MIETLRSLVAASIGATEGVHIVRFGHATETRSLWSIFTEPASRPAPWSTVIILFDGQADSLPESKSTFRPDLWLTPWDWAVAASLQMDSIPEVEAPSSFRCLIVDLLPRDAGRQGRTRFKSAGAFAPWIRWYRPSGQDDIDRQPLTHSFDQLFRDLAHLNRLPVLLSGETTSRYLRSAWLSQLSSVYSRHSIGNLVAPLLLQRGLKRSQGIDVDLRANESLGYFHAAMASFLGLGQVASYTRTKEEFLQRSDIQKRFENDPLGRYTAIRFVLVDDQIELGYHELLARTLFGNNCTSEPSDGAGCYASSWVQNGRDVSLHSFDSADRILDWIEEALLDAPEGPRVFAANNVDVLFLDLRLFGVVDNVGAEIDGPESEDVDRRMKHWARLLSIAKRMRLPEAGSRAVSRAIRAVKAKGNNPDSEESLEALALLPLILSEVDPSLPIILFSSTHQSNLMGLFDQYPNVISSFRKPIITGYDGGDEERGVLSRLEAAIRRALEFHEARGIWLRICKLEQMFRAKPGRQWHVRLKFSRSTSTRRSSFEVHDEITSRLAGEYKASIGSAQFANALLIPHNVLEYFGGNVASPIKDTSVLWLRDQAAACNRNRGSELLALERELMHDSSARGHVQCIVENAVEFAVRQSGASESDIGWLLHQVGYFPGASGNWAFDFKRSIVDDAAYARLSSLIGNSASQRRQWMESTVGVFTDKVIDDSVTALIRPTVEGLAEYQGFSLQAALRNARAHFKCRPGEHDEELRNATLWSWAFFLDCLSLLLSHGLPIRSGQLEDANLRSVVCQGCLPSTSIPAGLEGARLAETIIARFGSMISRKIFLPDPSLAPLVKYPLELAKRFEFD